MARSSSALMSVVVALLLLDVGCSGADDVMEPDVGDTDADIFDFRGPVTVALIPLRTVTMSLGADPLNAKTGQLVTFSITGSTSQGTITASRIDFENDGVWDDTRTHETSEISTSFTHTYASSGSYQARAQILKGSGILRTRGTTIHVTDP